MFTSSFTALVICNTSTAELVRVEYHIGLKCPTPSTSAICIYTSNSSDKVKNILDVQFRMWLECLLNQTDVIRQSEDFKCNKIEMTDCGYVIRKNSKKYIYKYTVFLPKLRP